jgi:hypothetical protein
MFVNIYISYIQGSFQGKLRLRFKYHFPLKTQQNNTKKERKMEGLEKVRYGSAMV